MLGLLMLLASSAEAVTLTGASEYAVPGDDFTLTCDVPEEAYRVRFYRRNGVTTIDQVGSVQVAGDSQCYNTQLINPAVCTPGVCSCQPSRANYGTSFQWVIQPQAGDHSSVWYSDTINPGTGDFVKSPDYTLKVAVPVTSVELQNPPSDGQPIDVTDNQSTNLVCVTSACRPSASILWSVGGVNFTSSSVPSVSSSAASDLFITTSTMTFTPTKVMAGQKVICMTYNIGAVVQATLQPTLNVRYGPGLITFTPPADVVETVENQTIPDVICSADCRPPCTYLWSEGGTNYANPLSLSKAVRGNAGQYVCISSNIVGQNTRTWSLIVRYPAKIISLTYTSGGVDVSENGETSLMCTVESYPASTIQWYYKANNTQLLSTPDTLESTYTLTGAGCLDTGVYTCSVTNSQSNTPVTMDIPVNVLCKPRLDFRQYVRRRYGLRLGENLSIPASFVSNPEPSYKWTFQNSSQSAVEVLIEGEDNFAIYNQYNENPLSAVSTGIRLGIQERWFGFYIVTATNNQGRSTLIYIVEAKGSDAEPAPGGSGPSSASVGILIGSAVFFIVGVLLFISSYLMRRGVIRSSKRKEKESSDVPLDNFSHSHYNANVEQQGPVPIDMSNYEQIQPRDPPSVYQDLPPVRQGNANSDDSTNYEALGRQSRPNVYESMKGTYGDQTRVFRKNPCSSLREHGARTDVKTADDHTVPAKITCYAVVDECFAL